MILNRDARAKAGKRGIRLPEVKKVILCKSQSGKNVSLAIFWTPCQGKLLVMVILVAHNLRIAYSLK